jgi:hypothetical protein
MTEVSDAILKRIKALLAMSRGNANENEAATAARKAQELLTEYNLSANDVESRDAQGKVIEDGDLMTSSSNPWRRSLGLAVARLYFCDYYWRHVYAKNDKRKRGYVRGDQHNFIGLTHNVVVAKEMFVYLVDTIERLAKESRKRRKERSAYENAFRFGCAKRIGDRIWERYHMMTEPPAGLLTKSNVPALYKGLQAEVSDYMEKNHTDLVHVDKYAGRLASFEGVRDGHKVGDSVSLDAQLEGEPLKKLKLADMTGDGQ